MMIAAHQNVPVHDFAWLAAEPPSEQTADTAESTQPTDVEERGAFYDGLSTDFDHAASAAPDRSAGPAEDGGPPPERDATPRQERGDDAGRPPERDLGARDTREVRGSPPPDPEP
jgi:hypothetical protein